MTTYQVGGSLNNEDPNYVTRQADIDLYNALSAGEFCYVFNSRQMGKSSLMVRTMHRLQEEGISCVAIDMTLIGSENITPDQWYKGLAVELWQSFGLFGQVNFKAWWNERLDISLAHRLGQFIEEVLLVEVETPHGLTSTEEHSPTKLVIFLDEIDSVLGLNFPVNDFFALIRFCYNQRSINPEYKRLTFALFGVATPSDLISDPNRTPFNIGRAIKLQGFRPAEAQPLANGLAGIVADPHQALQNILIWTGGQPFLTQKLCQLMVREHGAGGMRYGENEPALPMSHDASLIAELIYSHIIHNWESQDEPEHLRTISDRLLRNQQRAARLLGIYQQILQSTPEEEQGTEEGFPPPSSLI
ncbi:MAG TPA: hypothetical protein DC064_19230, partial [Cyanobacteria bacterium UBA9273]|nr:hypothetical protein [Cyanobacteria bacterium UBA9273]